MLTDMWITVSIMFSRGVEQSLPLNPSSQWQYTIFDALEALVSIFACSSIKEALPVTAVATIARFMDSALGGPAHAP